MKKYALLIIAILVLWGNNIKTFVGDVLDNGKIDNNYSWFVDPDDYDDDQKFNGSTTTTQPATTTQATTQSTTTEPETTTEE